MSVIDPNLLERRFRIYQAKHASEAILDAFDDSFARYLVIADRWAPGEYGLLLSRTRFVADLVDIASVDRAGRKYWEGILTKMPALLGTFIAGAVLRDLPLKRLEPLIPIDLNSDIESHIKSFLEDYLKTWPRRNELRAEMIDVNAVDETHLRTQQAIAVAGSRVVGILDLSETLSGERSRGVVMRASVAAPAAVVVSGAMPGGDPTNPGAFVAHPRISISGLATPGHALPFTVGFSDHPDPDAEEQKRIKIENPEPGETVLVIASAEGATIDEPAFVTLRLDLADEHEFNAQVSPTATRVSFRASYLFRNKPIGHIVRSVPLHVAQQAAHGTSVSTPISAKPSFARSLGSEAEINDVDLILFVEKGEPGCVSWNAYVPKTGQVHGPCSSEIGDPERFAKSLANLRKQYGDSSPSATDELRVTGQLIADCIPQKIMVLILSVLAQPRPPAVLIMTDQAFVPWELARLKSEMVNDNEPAFLGELARIGRWWTGASLSGPRSSRSIEHVSAVAATQYGLNTSYQTLAHAKAEREWLHTHYQATAVEATLPDIDMWLDTKPRPAGHLGHIALHGYSDTSADAQGLILGDGRVLTPSRLAGEYYEGDIPRFEMLFLNACQVGTAGERLGRIAGFPGAILRAGAAAFIGPLWEVQDSVAEKVAEAFYERVLGSHEEIGETLRQLRSEPSMRDSITPWAYLFYGHPRLQLTHS